VIHAAVTILHTYMMDAEVVYACLLLLVAMTSHAAQDSQVVPCFGLNVPCFWLNAPCFWLNAPCFLLNVPCFLLNVPCFWLAMIAQVSVSLREHSDLMASTCLPAVVRVMNHYRVSTKKNDSHIQVSRSPHRDKIQYNYESCFCRSTELFYAT
jgi:hypothetical protein